jgi:NDP-sugar pyrophosphorylase family protein
MVEVNGEPFVAHQLRLLRANGVTRVVMCVGYLGEQVLDYVGDGGRFGFDVNYSFDGPRLLGTAGALRRARALLGDAFFVLYGDSYLPCDFAAVHSAFAAASQPALMTVYRNDDLWDRSNVEFRDGAIVAYDKRKRTPHMRYIDYGLGVLTADVLDLLQPDQPYDLATLYALLLERRQLAGYEVSERFYEIGSLDGLADLENYLSARQSSEPSSGPGVDVVPL